MTSANHFQERQNLAYRHLIRHGLSYKDTMKNNQDKSRPKIKAKEKQGLLTVKSQTPLLGYQDQDQDQGQDKDQDQDQDQAQGKTRQDWMLFWCLKIKECKR